MRYAYDEKSQSIYCDVSNATECFDIIESLATEGYKNIDTVSAAKELLDELVSYARDGKSFLQSKKIFPEDTQEDDKKSLEIAGKKWQNNH